MSTTILTDDHRHVCFSRPGEGRCVTCGIFIGRVDRWQAPRPPDLFQDPLMNEPDMDGWPLDLSW